MKRNILFMIIMVLLCGQLLAAVPTAINYQGRLANAGGTSVPDGSYSIIFTIYDVASGGTSKWTETQSVTTSGGFFAVLLGTITPVTDTVFNGTDRYLGVKVGTEPELAPRKRLVSVPYADRVNTVDGASGGRITGNINLDPSTASTGSVLKGGTRFLHDYGTDNTFLGENAGNVTMSGAGNTVVGAFSFQDNTSGFQNTASGLLALANNQTGSNNTASGVNALLNNTHGVENCAHGVSTLTLNTSGDYNTATGANALYNNVADENTAYGHNALWANTNGFVNTACGKDALISNFTGSWNTACGSRALQYNTTGHDNTAIGYAAGPYDGGSGDLSNTTAIGAFAIVNASNKIRLGNSSVTVIEGQVAYTFTSDRNQKERFQPVDGDAVIRKIHDMNLTSWSYKFDSTGRRHYGPMAQDFFAAFGNDGVSTCGDSTTINSGDLAGITLIAVQTLEKEKELLKAKVASIQAQNTELRARLERMEATLNKIVGGDADAINQLSLK